MICAIDTTLVSSGVAEQDTSKKKIAYAIKDGTAFIRVKGTMHPEVPEYLQDYYVSTNDLTNTFDKIRDDKRVSMVKMIIDSPGGSVVGMFDLAKAVRDTNKVKPVYSYVSGNGASAAYLVAAQSKKIYGGIISNVGSIGAYMVIHDTSKMYEKDGIKPYLITSGIHKGFGVSGVPLSKHGLAEMQKKINALHGLFVASVIIGRKMTPEHAKSISDGRTFMGEDAVKNGLMDGVMPLNQFLSQVGVKGR